MTYAQDLDTGEIVQMPRAQIEAWCLDRIAAGHAPYVSETPIPAGHGAAYRRKLAEQLDEWSV